MEQLIVHGGNKLRGTVKIEGSKNVAISVLAATLLAEDTTVLTNMPNISDVDILCGVLKSLNAKVAMNKEKNEVTVNAVEELNSEANEYVSLLRASVLLMGALLSRNGYAKISMPGGCTIGKRPIDLHLKGFEALGAKVLQKDGYIEAFAEGLLGNNVYLDFPSVGATQNIILAAVKAKGETVIKNAAKELEVVELAAILNKMGANISGAGTKVIRIEGVKRLNGVEFEIVQDRIEAGTFMVAAAMTEGDVLIENAVWNQNYQLILKLTEVGAIVLENEGGIRVIGPKVITPVNITTSPHPGFPTDMQAPFSALMAIADGTGVVQETVFENRFQHLTELTKMNASIEIFEHEAVISGGNLLGAEVIASDLRAAAALVLAGLRARGVTRVTGLNHLDRGYYKFHEKLRKLGARIERVPLQNTITIKGPVQIMKSGSRTHRRSVRGE